MTRRNGLTVSQAQSELPMRPADARHIRASVRSGARKQRTVQIAARTQIAAMGMEHRSNHNTQPWSALRQIFSDLRPKFSAPMFSARKRTCNVLTPRRQLSRSAHATARFQVLATADPSSVPPVREGAPVVAAEAVVVVDVRSER